MARSVIRAAVLAGATLFAGVGAAEVTHWNVATPFPEASKAQAALVKAAKKLARSSNGEIRVGLDGHDPDPELSMLEVLTHDDSMDAALIPFTELSNLTPDVGLYGQFFVFPDQSEVKRVRRLLDQLFLSQVQSDGYAIVGILGLGFLHLMSANNFVSVTELNGQDVLVPVYSSTHAQLFDTMGLNPQTKLGETRTQLILTSPAALILDRSIPRLAYIVWPPVQYVYLVLVAKRDRWEALPDDTSAEIERMFVEQLGRLEQSAERTARRASAVLSKHGMRTIFLSRDDIAALRDAGTNHAISATLQLRLRNALGEAAQ